MEVTRERRRDTLVDARGLKCPLPVLKLEKTLAGATEGGRVIVLTTDPVARIDIPLYCRQQGYGFEVDEAEQGVMRFTITRSV